MSTGKDVGMYLLGEAIKALPELAKVIAAGTDNATGDQRALADEVAAILPADGASAQARRKLESQ